MKGFKVLLLLSLVPFSLYADHFVFETSDVNMSVLVRDIVLTQRHFGDGDELGLFTPGGICAGGARINQLPLGLAAWGDDAITDEIEGFRSNERIDFRYWDASENREILLLEIFPIQDEPIWQPNGFLVVDLWESGSYWEINPTAVRHKFICMDANIFQGDMGMWPMDLDQFCIRTSDNLPVGLIVWDNTRHIGQGWAFGDDTNTLDTVEGFQENDEFVFWFMSRDSFLVTHNMPVEGGVTSLQYMILEGDDVFRPSGQTSVYIYNLPVKVDQDKELPNSHYITGFYPNPFNGTGFLQFNVPIMQSYSIDIFDLNGRSVMALVNSTVQSGNNRIPVDFNHLPNGRYLCRVSSGSQNLSIPLMLIK